MNEEDLGRNKVLRSWPARHKVCCDLKVIPWGMDPGFPWQQRRLLDQQEQGLLIMGLCDLEVSERAETTDLHQQCISVRQVKLAQDTNSLKSTTGTHQYSSLQSTEDIQAEKIEKRKKKRKYYNSVTFECTKKAQFSINYAHYIFYSLLAFHLFNDKYLFSNFCRVVTHLQQ